MEYLEPKRHNEEHQKAFRLLKESGYNSFLISKTGALTSVKDIDSYLIQNRLESDNIVFKKT